MDFHSQTDAENVVSSGASAKRKMKESGTAIMTVGPTLFYKREMNMTLDLIKIRRELHQIPEIGLEEVKTQAYLLERISEITAGKDFVEQRTWRTGILVFLKAGHLRKRLAGVRILMLCLLLKRQGLILPVSIRDVCMPAAMICI